MDRFNLSELGLLLRSVEGFSRLSEELLRVTHVRGTAQKDIPVIRGVSLTLQVDESGGFGLEDTEVRGGAEYSFAGNPAYMEAAETVANHFSVGFGGQNNCQYFLFKPKTLNDLRLGIPRVADAQQYFGERMEKEAARISGV
ncbi:MAG: hypothetical protein KKF56_03600 [Nanoarchaeota archaeon]|nr:hypothetical protein [Nanoarchaeota archaeon]